MKIKELYDRVNDGKIISDIELQREIVYSDEKQVLVIDSIVQGIPLPAFYFWKNDDGILEVLDGKQRIEAIRRFYQNDIQYEGKLWKQYDAVFQEKINETEISDIICSGTEDLKREIFSRINTLGVPLSKFEVLNGLYNGEYLRGLTAFVKQDPAVLKVLGTNNRGANQLWILKCICILKNKKIEEYVAENQNISFETDQRMITKNIKFIRDVFEKYGEKDIYFSLSKRYENDVVIWKQHKTEINRQISDYLKDRTRVALTSKSKEIEDIIQAIVKNISVDSKRLFTADDKIALLQQQTSENNRYQCAHCQQLFFANELEIDHITAWSKGGRTVLSNAQLLCRACNAAKGNR
jgi:5-methylcytosine-specific restriction endonuclease McrA